MRKQGLVVLVSMALIGCGGGSGITTNTDATASPSDASTTTQSDSSVSHPGDVGDASQTQGVRLLGGLGRGDDRVAPPGERPSRFPHSCSARNQRMPLGVGGNVALHFVLLTLVQQLCSITLVAREQEQAAHARIVLRLCRIRNLGWAESRAAPANAVYDATGKRIVELPMTAERVKGALG